MSIGKHYYGFSIDKEFFKEFENREIEGADLLVSLTLERSVSLIEIKAHIVGKVLIECDRCLDELELELDTHATLVVKFTANPLDDEDGEILRLDPNESELDLKQFLYDTAYLGLPMQRVHEEKKCNPQMIERLNALTKGEPTAKIDSSPFDKLKDLLN